jgi:hypothetical protein
MTLLIFVWVLMGYIAWFFCTKEELNSTDKFSGKTEEIVFFSLFLLPLCLILGPTVWFINNYLNKKERKNV